MRVIQNIRWKIKEDGWAAANCGFTQWARMCTGHITHLQEIEGSGWCNGAPDGTFTVSPNEIDNWCHPKSEHQSTQSVIVNGIVDYRGLSMCAEGRWWSVTFVFGVVAVSRKEIQTKAYRTNAWIGMMLRFIDLVSWSKGSLRNMQRGESEVKWNICWESIDISLLTTDTSHLRTARLTS